MDKVQNYKVPQSGQNWSELITISYKLVLPIATACGNFNYFEAVLKIYLFHSE